MAATPHYVRKFRTASKHDPYSTDAACSANAASSADATSSCQPSALLVSRFDGMHISDRERAITREIAALEAEFSQLQLTRRTQTKQRAAEMDDSRRSDCACDMLQCCLAILFIFAE